MFSMVFKMYSLHMILCLSFMDSFLFLTVVVSMFVFRLCVSKCHRINKMSRKKLTDASKNYISIFLLSLFTFTVSKYIWSVISRMFVKCESSMTFKTQTQMHPY